MAEPPRRSVCTRGGAKLFKICSDDGSFSSHAFAWRVVADEWMVRYGRGIGIGRGIISVSDRLVRKKERRVPAG